MRKLAVVLLAVATLGAAAPDEGPRPDMNAQRRANRERLELRLSQAREKLEKARKALEEEQEPTTEERQVIQRQASDPEHPKPGMLTTAGRTNCRPDERDGKKTIVCPVSIPTQVYYDRISRMQDEVKRAEKDVEDAERAYRRGID